MVWMNSDGHPTVIVTTVLLTESLLDKNSIIPKRNSSKYKDKILNRSINPLPHTPEFNDHKEEISIKTLWENEKMLVNSIFSFFHIVFYLIKDRYPSLIDV